MSRAAFSLGSALGSALGVAVVSTVVLGGCKAPSQIVLGFATDLSAPGVLDQVKMRVVDNAGATLTEHGWTLSGQRQTDFALPGSFNLYSEAGGEPTVRVELSGLRNGVEIVHRSSGLAFVSESDLFFRMTLVQACMGMDCGPGKSCIEGKCRPEAVNVVSLRAYTANAERTVDCDSGQKLIDTSTMEPLPVEGDGFCEVNEWCGESTCYRNQGQGLVWCSPKDNTCRGIDGYEGCVIGKCETELVGCYGPDWRRGKFAGPCDGYATCRSQCDCDPACITKCDADRPSACSACLSGSGGVDGCLASADAACTLPSCTPRASTDDGGVSADGGAMAGVPGMVDIPGGTFVMGCAGAVSTPDFCAFDTTPAHGVKLGAYSIGMNEVSQAEFEVCVQAKFCQKPGMNYDPILHADLPVVGVSWDEANTYCTFIGMKFNRSPRLPTEAEWEFAAHGVAGATAPGPYYPWGNTDPDDNCDLASWAGCGPSGPDPVGLHPLGMPGNFGLHDLIGNVAEWTFDLYDSMQYTTDHDTMDPIDNPMGAMSGSERGIRGGSWMSSNTDGQLHATTRSSAPPTSRFPDLGFRCVLLPAVH